MIKWWKEFNKKSMAKRTCGIAEKKAAMDRKLEAALNILEKRKVDVPVSVERRKQNNFELKHA